MSLGSAVIPWATPNKRWAASSKPIHKALLVLSLLELVLSINLWGKQGLAEGTQGMAPPTQQLSSGGSPLLFSAFIRMLFPEKLDADKKGRPTTAGSKIKVGPGVCRKAAGGCWAPTATFNASEVNLCNRSRLTTW